MIVVALMVLAISSRSLVAAVALVNGKARRGRRHAAPADGLFGKDDALHKKLKTEIVRRRFVAIVCLFSFLFASIG